MTLQAPTVSGGQQATPPASERRGAERFPCVRECLVRPQNATGAGDWHAIAYNISTSGIGIGLPYPVEPGTVLYIHPWSRSNARPVRARVVRSTPVDFLWFHGCELLETLTADEVQLWVN
jgi:PilZ domain